LEIPTKIIYSPEPVGTKLSTENIQDIRDIITAPGGGRLILPSEESLIKLGDAPRPEPVDLSLSTGRSEPKDPHEKGKETFTRVFVNDAAGAETEKENPQFPAGSIIVREKLLRETDTEPQLVAVMVKREKGFHTKTGDWEFFILDGKSLKMQKRETGGDCAKCHIQAQKTDWVFRDYLK
jgi:hypothetical protein